MSVLRYFYSLSLGYRFQLVLNLLLGMLNIVLGLAFIYVGKDIVDIATGRHQGHLWQQVGVLALMLLLRLGLTAWRQWVAGRVQQRMVNGLRSRLFALVMRRPWVGRSEMATGDVMSRLGEDLRLVVNCIESDIPSVVLALFQLLAASWFLFLLQPQLLWALLCIFPLALVLSRIYYRTMRRLTRQIRAQEADIQSHIQESVQNRPLLLSLRRVGLMAQRLSVRHAELFATFSSRLRFNIHTRVFIQGGFSVGYYTAFVWSAYGLMTGSVTYGMMTALLQLVAQVQRPILDLATLFPSIVQATTSSDRLRELGPLPLPTADDSKSAHSRPAVDAPLSATQATTYGIRLQQVDFRYPDGDDLVISQFSHTFAPGTATAIVGPTGSGKSTLVRLLLGVLTPTSGTVECYDDEGHTLSLSGSTATDLPIAYVPQGNSLLRGTIRDNLLLGCLTATDAQLHDALRRASALFVYDLPHGLDTQCGEKGGGLSEGQAQRIAIARALLQPGSILLLDEASSALDPDTERQILEELQQQSLGKTLIWVTHHEVVCEYMENSLAVGALNS